MPMSHISHTRKLELALEEAVVYDLHLIDDLDLHSVDNITLIWFENSTLEVTSTILSYLYIFYCFRKIKT